MVLNSHARNFPPRGKNANIPPFVAQLPFDLSLFDPTFTAPPDDQDFTDKLLQHYNSLIPCAADQQILSGLFTHVTELLEALIVNPTQFTTGRIEEVRSIGPFKLGTWLAGNNTAELAVVFRTLPTLEAVNELCRHLRTQLVESSMTNEAHKDCVVTEESFGFSVTLTGSQNEPDAKQVFTVRGLITTLSVNLKNLDDQLHVPVAFQKSALAAIRQTRWLEENASHTTVKVATRLLKNFCERYSGLRYISDWLINLLAYFIVLQNPANQPFAINQAFRRWFQLLSAGFLLPGSAGMIDPCEPGNLRLHSLLSLEQQDEICCTAQTLLRILGHGVYDLLFQHDDRLPDCSMANLVAEASNRCGINIELSKPVCNPNDEIVEA